MPPPAERAFSIWSACQKCAAALTAALILSAGCLHKSPLRRESLTAEIDRTAAVLSRDMSRYDEIKNRRVGTSGYFYVIDGEGTVLFHPQGALAGMSFSAVPMVQRILEKKKGCLSQSIEGMEKIVLFRPARGGRTLCLTVSVRDIEGGLPECEEMK